MSVTLRKETNLYDTDAIQDGINAAVTDYDTNLGQARVFNKLTNNGTAQGIFMEDGQLYINMSYLQTGTLKLGGANNTNGLLKVYDASGNKTGEWNNYMFQLDYSISADNQTFVVSDNSGFIIYDSKSEISIAPYSKDSIVYRAWVLTQNESDDNWTSIFAPNGMRARKTESGTQTYLAYLNPDGIYCKNNTTGTYFRYNVTDGLYAVGSFSVTGTKSREVATEDYGDRLLYCYETPSPLFGDVGEGTIADDGKCYVMIDSIFAETVSLKQYQVTIQKYGDGDCWVAERKGAYFVVEGTPGLAFGWELKAKQSDFDQKRLELNIEPIVAQNSVDYAQELTNHIEEIAKEREVA